MSQSHRLLKNIRALHLYLGVFTAPALLFFAFTGGLQTFGLHESSRGSDYQPPSWLVSMAHLHKKQSLEVPVRKRRPPPAKSRVPRADSAVAVAPIKAVAQATQAGARVATPAKPQNLLPMKIFFALVALSLAFSTLGGVYMAYRFRRDARLISAILSAGLIVPLLLMLV